MVVRMCVSISMVMRYRNRMPPGLAPAPQKTQTAAKLGGFVRDRPAALRRRLLTRPMERGPRGSEEHDEALFIVLHQVYELSSWTETSDPSLASS
jgi:hypothetical protein